MAKEIAALIKSLAAEKGSPVETVIEEIQTSLVTLGSLHFTVRTKNVLTANRIKSVEKLCTYSAEELRKLPLGSKKMISEIVNTLESRGLALKAGSEKTVK